MKRPVVQGLIFGSISLVFTTVFATIVGLLIADTDSKGPLHDSFLFLIILYVTSAVIPSLIIALVSPAALKLATDRFTRILGFTPTPHEQVEVRAWFNRGIQPQSERLVKVLPKYLAHIEPFVNGKYLYPYKWLTIAMFILFMSNVVIYGAKIITGFNVSGFDIYFFIFSLLFAFATVPVTFKNGNPLIRFMNRRNLVKYNMRKSELGL